MKGATIRHRLAQVGMTQAELAQLLKVTPQTVNLSCTINGVASGIAIVKVKTT